MFDISNIMRSSAFRFLNIGSAGSLAPTSNLSPGTDRLDPRRPDRPFLSRWRNLLPLTVRVPIVSGALILVVAIAISRLMMSFVAHEQELGVRQIAAVYLDGIATTVYPHIVARNLTNTNEALHRTMWFHQGMREQRAIVRLPDGTIFADVFGPNSDIGSDDPLHDPVLSQQLDQGGGFVFDLRSGTGWASRAIVRDGRHVADLYVAVELKALIEERQALRHQLRLATVLSSLGAAVIGFLIVRRMVSPVRLVTDRLRRAQAGDFERVTAELLPPPSSEYGRLLRGYNDLVDAIGEREALAAKLAQRERESVLGRLAATIAHEVRNPLGGMSTALNTARKFGDDPSIRATSLDLIDRGLASIGDVVDSVLTFHRPPLDSRRLTAPDLNDLRTLIQPELIRRQLRLAWNCEIEGTIGVAATETRQIALNLLLNACAASPPGGEIGFRAWMQEDPTAAARLVLQVDDDGPGLPEAVSTALMKGSGADPQDLPRGLGIRVICDLVRSLKGEVIATKMVSERGSRILVSLPLGFKIDQEGAT